VSAQETPEVRFIQLPEDPPHAPYKDLIPPQNPEEYEAMKTDIALRGVQDPLVMDEQGNLLAGYHRDKACRELRDEGCPSPHIRGYMVIVRRGLTEDQKKEYALKDNVLRRQLQPYQWGAAFKMLLEQKGVQMRQGARTDLTFSTDEKVRWCAMSVDSLEIG
jgi:ParB-like chromosome segregation protein Spo0J